MSVLPFRPMVLAAACLAASVPSLTSADAFAQDVSAARGAPPVLRLPREARPTRQSLELSIDPTAERLSGTTTVDVAVLAPLPVLWLNAAQLTVRDASMDIGGQHEPLTVVPGNDHTVGLRRTQGDIAAGNVRFTMSFEGVISRRDTEGVFAQQADGDWYAFTHFEPLGARRAFPCFDEPGFKIPWQITLHVPAALAAFSNAPEVSRTAHQGVSTVVFAPTLPLPSYLVAAAVGPFDVVDAGRAGRNRTPMRIIVTRGRGAEAAHAARLTPVMLTWLEDYFDTPFPFEKLDQISVPRFGGAMENAGLVTFLESLLLQKPDEESLGKREWYLKVAVHEIAHHWFGDLVTMAWWDDLWLNEGFSSWLHQRAADELAPDLGLTGDAGVTRSLVLTDDGLVTARRVRQPIESHQDIEGAFDAITYEKSQSVIQMVESWVGRDVLRRGVQRYLAAHARGSATAADFVAALSAEAGRDLTPVFTSFLDQSGAPIVEVALTCDAGPPRARLRQRRYVPLGAPAVEATTWTVPVCLSFPAGNGTARQCVVLRGSDDVALKDTDVCPTRLLGNADYAGYYRTLHAPSLLTALVAAKSSLSPAARYGLVADTLALIRSGDETAGRGLELSAAFADDRDRHVVGGTIELITAMRPFVPAVHTPTFERYVRHLFGERARGLGWRSRPSESNDSRRLRADVLRTVGVLGRDHRLRREAVALARGWLADPAAIERESVGPVLAMAVASADARFLTSLAQFLITSRDRWRREEILGALRAAEGPEAARVLLPLVLDPKVEPLEALDVLRELSRSRDSADAVFSFVEDHYDAIQARLPKGSLGSTAALMSIGNLACDDGRRNALERFFGPRVDAIANGPRLLAQALEGIDQCIAQRRVIEPDLQRFFASWRPAGARNSAPARERPAERGSSFNAAGRATGSHAARRQLGHTYDRRRRLPRVNM